MEDRDEEECFHILDRLGEILSNLQCLPTSVATLNKVVGKPWVIGKHGKDVDGSKDGSIDMEDIIEEATRKDDRDMVMEDPSNSEDKGRSDVLMEEESDKDSDYHMDED
ncbi:hypothetical protein PAXRUDRAFT_21405 [Paxillus rubicundulus Ve08.2h10]|uniref:EF-hand domain-containing protein n=1 Tax=Paxillus rubicundulus Ve08.2h10 TaxID=930991 RepID=A0A0D0CZR1_9AGAM|nr:hypothetical protein PAXRUDRAFT_21405 [Paxillus rubicundulus Ve08.2h10]